MADAKKTMQIVIEAKNEASATFDQVGKQAGGLSTGFSSVALALVGVAGTFGYLGKQMIDSAAKFEQTKVAFKNMLGSAEQANTLLKDLADFAMKTPFELKDLEDGAKRLMAYGTAARDIIPQLGMLGTAASLTGVPINQLANAFGQVQVKGKLMGGEVLQFMNAGIPITRLLAESMGKTTAEVAKYIETGKIGFNEVNKVMEANYGQSSKNGKLMEEQSKTFLGRVSNLKDAWDNFLRTQGAGLLVFANMAIDKLSLIVNWLREDANGINLVGQSLYGLINFFAMLGKIVWAVITVFGALITMLGQVGMVVYALARDMIANFTSAGRRLSDIFGAVGEAIKGNFSSAGDMIKRAFTEGTLVNTTAQLSRMKEVGKDMAFGVGGAFADAGKSVVKFATNEGFAKAKVEYGALGESAKKSADEVAGGAKKGSDELKKMADANAKYGESVKKTFEDVKDALDTTKTKISEIMDKMNELANKNANDQRELRAGFADAYVGQEQKVAEAKIALENKKADLAKTLNTEVTGDNIKSHNEELARMQAEQTALQNEFNRQKKALDDKKTIETAYLSEVNEARRVAGLTEFERQVEALTQKQMQMAQDYEAQRKKLEGELKMEVDKYNILKKLQDEAEKEAKRSLTRGEKASIDSINAEIAHWNVLAQAIARAKSGATSGGVSSASVDAKLKALGGAQAVNITISGNSFLDDKAAEKVGNLLVQKLQKSNLTN